VDVNTTVTLLTAPGRSAIAVIGVAGDGAAEAIGQFFEPAVGGPVSGRAIGRVVFGDWQRGDQGATGEGVVVRRTGENRWEIQSHGGTAAAEAILSDLTATGCQQTEWRDEALRSAGDPLAAAATIALTRAVTERAAVHLLAQQRGALRSALAEVTRQLAAEQFELAFEGLRRLIANSHWGLHLTEPWKVTLCGSPNVGKSSLVNALLGYNRAIVFDRPGTTRDVLTATTAIEGWPVEFSDTAGLRTGGDELEAAGIARARKALASADLVVPVIDRSKPLSDDDTRLLTEFGRQLIVANKSDLPPVAGLDQVPGKLIATSATAGTGIAELLEAIIAELLPEQPSLEEAALFTGDQVELSRQALEFAQNGDAAAAIESITRLMCGDAAPERSCWASFTDTQD